MKKILFMFLFLTLFFQDNANAKNTKFYLGSLYSGIIKFKFIEYELPNGECELFDRSFDAIDELPSIRMECMSFIQNLRRNILILRYRTKRIGLVTIIPRL